MKRRKFTWLVALAVLFVFSMIMVACKPDPEPEHEPEPTLYTVTFDSNGGSAVPDQGVYAGEKITEPGDPTRGGYTFVAWYKEEGLTTEWKFDTDTVSSNITLYAKWEFAPATSDEYFSYAAVEGGYMISAKLGETMPAALVIPSEKDGQDVVAIADNAFENQASVTSVLIPDTVTEIGRQAFRNCANLAAVNEGNNIASIAPNAFYGTAWDSNLTGGEVYLGKTLYKYAGGMYTDTEITVKEGTLGIAGNAFNGMDKLVKVTLPVGLTNIGEYAFGGAQTGTGLTEITFPDSVTEIGANAFRNAKSLAKVTIGANVAYIGDNAFGGTAVSDLTYGANAEFGAQGPFRGLTAAATVTLGDNVTAFPAKLFEEWTGLASVSLGGVTQLPANAFDGFENLATVALDDVTVLGDYAFRGTALTEVTIPEGVTSIGNGVFANCPKLAKVNYNAADASAPNSANNAFAGCTALASVVIGEGAAVPDYFFQNLTSLTSADISKAESIGISAFQNTSLTALSTGSVKEIGKSAFQGAKIAELTVGEALESIGYNAFAGNAELTKVIWNATAAETIYEASGAGLVRAIFNDCTKLATVEVGENVKSLPDYFLPNNTLVTKIDLPAGIESVGDSAFNGCTALAEISNANKLQTIGQDAFTGTPWFTEYLETDGLVYLGSVLYVYNGDMPADTTIEVRDGTTAIANGAFDGKSNLVAVTLPDTLTTIGNRAFAGTSLTTLTIPASVESIGSEAFTDVETLTSVTFNEGLKTIGANAFDGCSLLNTIALPNSLTSLGNNAFQYAGRDAAAANGTLTIGTGLTEIPQGAFSGMSKTGGALTIPAGITKIGASAFSGTSSFTSIVIPEGVTEIGERAFAGTRNIKAVVFPSTIQALGTWVFEGSGVATVELKGSFTEIPAHAFRSCSSLTSITWQDSITSIGEYAFAYCNSLKEVDLTGVADIGMYAFNPDTQTLNAGLTSVTFSDSLRNIGDFAFADAPISGELSLPNGTLTIGEQAFKGTKLTKVTVPATVTMIEAGAFQNISTLTEVVLTEGLTYVDGFAQNTNLVSVTIPSSVTRIGGTAFSGGNTLYIYLNCSPDTVIVGSPFLGNAGLFVPEDEYNDFKSSENWSAYADQFYLASQHLGNGFIVDENGLLLKYLSNSQTVEIPAGVKDIDYNSFAGRISAVTTVTISADNTDLKADGAAIYTADGKTLVYYVEYGDRENTELDLTEISSIRRAIKSRFLTSVIIGDGITTIPENAFKDCSAIVEVNILSETPATIGENAFPASARINVPAGTADAYKSAWSAYAETIFETGVVEKFVVVNGVLTEYNGTDAEVVLPDNVTSIAANVFRNHPEITKITLPAGLTTIPDYSFYESTSLTHVVFNSTNFADRSQAGRQPTEAQQLFPNMTTLEIGADVTRIPRGMFAFTALTSIVIPATVTTIDQYAFYNCESLTSVTLNEGLTTLGNGAFQNCAIGGTLTIPSTLTSFGANAFAANMQNQISLVYNVPDLQINTMSHQTGLFATANVASVQFGANVVAIPAMMFNGNTTLTAIVLPDTITKIGERAFANCTNLESINIPNGVTEIPYAAFQNCAKLTGTLTISENVTSIGNQAFVGTGYTKLVYNAKSATSVSTRPNKPLFPATIAEVEFGAGVTKIPNSFMESNTSLTSIVIPEGVTEIGKYAFRNATALASISLPDSLESFGAYADNAMTFMGTKITNIVIPDKVTEMPRNMFAKCNELVSITYGSGITQANYVASAALPKLAEIIFTSATPPTISTDFLEDQTLANLQIKVPAAAVDAYKAAENWTAYADRIVANTEAAATSAAMPEALPAPSSKDEL